jgi:hypothetical protein
VVDSDRQTSGVKARSPTAHSGKRSGSVSVSGGGEGKRAKRSASPSRRAK